MTSTPSLEEGESQTSMRPPIFTVGGRYQLILDSLHDEKDLQKSLKKLIDLAKEEKKPIPLVENSGAQLCADSL